jgi:hypothetical protein
MNVSLICACKNRYKPLKISLQSWLLFDEIKEIIIVDWSSDEPLEHLTELDPRIKVITVPNKKYFNQPQPLNLAASLATGDSIMKFDIDYIINPYYNFFETYKIDETCFQSGARELEYPDHNIYQMNFDDVMMYAHVHSAYFKSLIGLLHITKENFEKVGGYNEELGEFYGFEDEELQMRLELMGLKHNKIRYDHNLIHIPHPDSKRFENFKGVDKDMFDQYEKNLSTQYSGDVLKYQLEYAIAQYHIQRNKKYFSEVNEYYVQQKTKWNIKQTSPQRYVATEMNNLENFPPVYYVTLEDCVDRQELLEKEFGKYGVIPKAVVSKRYADSTDVVTGKYLYQLTGPTQGCIVSHLKAIKQWYESEESDYAFFCEDDLSLKTVDHWNFKWEEFIERLPEDCECVQLMAIRGDFSEINFRNRKWDDWSETAYIMNRDYAKKLIDNYCVGDTFHLELKGLDVMPIGENILFTNVGKVYTFPLFVENVEIPTTDVNDLELDGGQKPNHYYASEYVYNWWKENGKKVTIDELMSGPIIVESSTPRPKKKNVVDCFPYFNEKELLELRINLLKDHVDKFIITDGNYTHSGIPKEYTLKKTIKELGLPEDMIEVIEVDLSEGALGAATPYEKQWDEGARYQSREKVQRNSLAQSVRNSGDDYDDDTMFIVSDCDEILDPQYIPILHELARTHPNNIYKADLVHLEGRADMRAYHKETGEPREWRYSLFVCMKAQAAKLGFTYIRADQYNPFQIVWPYTEGGMKDGVYVHGQRMTDLGWHFSWMGSNDNRLEKARSFCHAGWSFDYLEYENYTGDAMKEFMANYECDEGIICPSGMKDYIMKPYPVEKLPQIIFDLPRVKEFLLPEKKEVLGAKNYEEEIIKNGIEQLLTEFSLDTENPVKNFNLGLWYENKNHTAPALSYFLRSAERATDENLAYEALIKSHHCYDRQGTRDGTAVSLLQQALCLMPKRPEAYFLLARFHERRQQWNDSYKYSSLALDICDFDLKPLNSEVEYPGKYGLLFEKAVSGYWWGKGDQSRKIFEDLLSNYKMTDSYRKSVIDNLERIKK